MKNNENFIMLCGMPRSGTTWFGKMFDSHPDVHYRHETDTHLTLNNIFSLFPQTNEFSQFSDLISDYVNEELMLCSNKICGNGELFVKSYRSSMMTEIQNLKILSTRAIERITGKKIYWRQTKRAHHERLVWKSIESLGRLGIIANVFQNSKFVIIMRNPCGYIASIRRGEKQGKFGSYISSDDYNILKMLLNTEYGKQLNLQLDDLKNMTAEERLAYKWLLYYQKALDDTKNLKNCAVIRYEDVCKAPTVGFKQLFKFTDLGWTNQTEEFLLSSISSNNSSYYDVHRDPLVAAMKWKSELTDNQVNSIMGIVRKHPAGSFYYDSENGDYGYSLIGSSEKYVGSFRYR